MNRRQEEDKAADPRQEGTDGRDGDRANGEPGGPPAGGFPWDVALQVLGLGAALAAWVAVVGGGKLWARFESANIPTTQTLAGLPRELMITEGLQTLLVPLLLGTAAAGLFLAVVPPADPDARGRKLYDNDHLPWIALIGGAGLILIVAAIAEVDPLVILISFGLAVAIAVAGLWFRWPAIFAAISIGVALAGVLLAIILAIEGWALGAMLAVTVAAVVITAILLARVRRPYAALTLFSAFVVWAGALGYVQEAGDKTPRLELAAVFLEDGTGERGYFLGRSSDRLYLAQKTEGDDDEDDPVRHVLVLENDDIDRVLYGTGVRLPEAPEGHDDEDQTGPGPDDPPGGGGDGGGGGHTGGGGTDVPTPPGPEPPQPAALPLPTPGDREAGMLDGVRVELQVLALVRRDRLFELDARLVNVSDVRGEPQSLRVFDALDDGDPMNEPFTVDKIRLVDSSRRELYPVLYDDEGHCACTQRLDRAMLKPGESWRLWAAFPAPQAEVSSVDLAAPGFAWIPHVGVD